MATTLANAIMRDIAANRPTAGSPGRLFAASDTQILYRDNGSSWDVALSVSMTNPMTTPGDIITGGASGTAQRLGIGSSGQVLTVVGGAPAWATPAPFDTAANYTVTGSWIFSMGATKYITYQGDGTQKAFSGASGNYFQIAHNAYYDGASWTRDTANPAANVEFDSSGNITFYAALTGTAGTAPTWRTLMQIQNAGDVKIYNNAIVGGDGLGLKLLGTTNASWLQGDSGYLTLTRNAVFNGSAWVRDTTSTATKIEINTSGVLSFQYAASGTAGSSVSSWTTYSFPTTNGTGPLSNNGSGALTWTGQTLATSDTPVFAGLTLTGVQPASVGTTPGTAAATLINATAGTGGNTTIATTGVGGIGGALAWTGGTGGTAASAATASTGGKGGTLTLTGGTGGAATGTAGVNVGGAGGDLYLLPGAGGAASGGTSNTAGAAGNVLLAVTSGGTARGRVGVGTNAPNGTLAIGGPGTALGATYAPFVVAGTNQALQVEVYSAVAGTSTGWFSRRARGTIAAPTAVVNGDRLWFFGADGHDGTGFTGNSSVAIFGVVDGAVSTGIIPGRLEIYTQNSSGSAILRLNINSGGGWVLFDGTTFDTGTTTGLIIGSATNRKIGLWGKTPIVQPTTAIAAAAFVANTSAIANDTATWGGYTIGQVVQALRNFGVLA